MKQAEKKGADLAIGDFDILLPRFAFLKMAARGCGREGHLTLEAALEVALEAALQAALEAA